MSLAADACTAGDMALIAEIEEKVVIDAAGGMDEEFSVGRCLTGDVTNLHLRLRIRNGLYIQWISTRRDYRCWWKTIEPIHFGELADDGSSGVELKKSPVEAKQD